MRDGNVRNIDEMLCYAAGERDVPPVLMARLGKLLAQRQAQIAKLQPSVAAAGDE
jgi:hypothetical protein